MKTNLSAAVIACWYFSLTANWVLAADRFEVLAVVRELDEIKVPAKRDGLIEELVVHRGDQIASAALLARLDTTDLRLSLNVASAELKQAEAKAQNDGPLEVAAAAVGRAEEESRLLSELGQNVVYLERFRMENSLVRSAAEVKTAKNVLRQDQLHVAVKQSQILVLENDIRQTIVRSPATGIIREMLKHQGEWVKQGEPICTVTRMDKLLVEGFLDSNEVAPDFITGATATATIEGIDGSLETFTGLVVEQTVPKLELDGKFPVWVTITNRLSKDKAGADRWLVRPGMTGKLTISLQ